MSERASLPRWLKFANPVIVALQRRGVVIGTMRLLAVPGRKSGQLRTTPVSPPEQGATWSPVFSATLRYLRHSTRVRSAGVPMSGVPGGGGWTVI
jgi:hypothetical protein